MHAWRVFALTLVGLGCSDEGPCTLALCFDGFSIVVSEPPEPGEGTSSVPLPEGVYELELSLDGAPITCHRTIPGELSLDCTATPVIVEGFTPDLVAVTAFNVVIRTTPRTVNATVRYQGSVLAQQIFEPQYRTVAPNGERCGPVCKSSGPELLPLAF